MMRIYGILNALYDLQDGLYGLETKNIADLYERGSGELSIVAKLEYVRTVTSLEELKTYKEDGLDYTKADKSDFVGADEYYVWRILDFKL